MTTSERAMIATMTLTEFLLARIAEDEAVAGALTWMPRWVMAHDLPSAQPELVEHVMRHDPARVLAECGAKRRIVEWASDGEGEFHWSSVLAPLAAVYADHPDYDEAWRP